jgi:hypothetical protein
MHTTCTTKHVIKYSHCPKLELTYIVVLAYMPILMDLRAIRFKHNDRIKHFPIGFQSVTPVTAQDDKHFCA